MPKPKPRVEDLNDFQLKGSSYSEAEKRTEIAAAQERARLRKIGLYPTFKGQYASVKGSN